MSEIVKDTDTTIELTLTDENGTAVNLDTVPGIVVNVFQKSIPFDKFSKVAMSGHRSIDVVNASEGRFKIYLNANNTHKGIVGKPIFYEIKTNVVNTNFDSGQEEKSTGVIELATLVESRLKEQNTI